MLAWQTNAAAGSFITGTVIQGLLVLNYPAYVYENWHGTLLMIAMGLFSVFFNTVLARKLPMIEGLVLLIHIGAFFGIVVTLWVLAPRADVGPLQTHLGPRPSLCLGIWATKSLALSEHFSRLPPVYSTYQTPANYVSFLARILLCSHNSVTMDGLASG